MHVSANATPARLEILMYHSISHEPGPTSISPDTFEAQLRSLRLAGYSCVSLSDVGPWAAGERALPERSFVLTFDDGFADFADAAFPRMQAQGYTATVFLPTDRLGGCEDWYGANTRARKLMDWTAVEGLAAEGIEFGGHSATHADLTTLPPAELEHEIRSSQDAIHERLGLRPITFAPPYGSVNPDVLSAVARHADVAVGTRFDRAGPADDVVDLPRLEMFYFRSSTLWDLYLRGRGDGYMRLRQWARAVRGLLL